MRAAKRKKEWFDNDSFWRELYAFMFPKERIAAADDQVEKALALTKPAGKSILDLCCGPGRCSIALARRGFSVTGVDKTKYLLDKARAEAKAAGASIEWVQKDMRDFRRANSSTSCSACSRPSAISTTSGKTCSFLKICSPR